MLGFIIGVIILSILIAIVYIIVGPKFTCPNCGNKSTFGLVDVTECSFCKKKYLINRKTKTVIKEL